MENQPSAPVQLRLYYTAAELTALQQADPQVVNAQSLGIIKYQGPTEDGIYDLSDASQVDMILASQVVAGTHPTGTPFVEFEVGSFSEFWIGTNNVILPVELISFTATNSGDNVLLQWATSSEDNSSHFEVERSANGVEFRTLGSVNAAGSSTGQQFYSFDDINPLSGSNYYRLKLADRDGRFRYSALQTVNRTARGLSINLYPVPAGDRVRVDVSGYDQKSRILIRDLYGRVVVNELLPEQGRDLVLNRGIMTAGYYIYSVLSLNNELLVTGKLLLK